MTNPPPPLSPQADAPTLNALADRVERAEGVMDGAHDAFNRMKLADENGTGCYLTAKMIRSLSVTCIGEIWSQPDPRAATPALALASAALKAIGQLGAKP